MLYLAKLFKVTKRYFGSSTLKTQTSGLVPPSRSDQRCCYDRLCFGWETQSNFIHSNFPTTKVLRPFDVIAERESVMIFLAFKGHSTDNGKRGKKERERLGEVDAKPLGRKRKKATSPGINRGQSVNVWTPQHGRKLATVSQAANTDARIQLETSNSKPGDSWISNPRSSYQVMSCETWHMKIWCLSSMNGPAYFCSYNYRADQIDKFPIEWSNDEASSKSLAVFSVGED
ncbi:hypothetical protein RRG08_008057 [Elysia crispata]|uniref:Uncharacterized protein n=1 Tax=Elysia crispata TaxID=231223 RepID=A0AAE0YY36_9GAST|nr:hypothetical protein RRG08_008057 [Elysia crispata]